MTARTIKRALETVGTIAVVVTAIVIVCAFAEVTPTPMDYRSLNAYWAQILRWGR